MNHLCVFCLIFIHVVWTCEAIGRLKWHLQIWADAHTKYESLVFKAFYPILVFTLTSITSYQKFSAICSCFKLNTDSLTIYIHQQICSQFREPVSNQDKINKLIESLPCDNISSCDASFVTISIQCGTIDLFW